MAGTKKKVATFSASGPRPVGPPRPRSWSGAIGALLRAFVLAAFAVGGAAWALVRYYTHPRPPMVVQVPLSAADASAPSPSGEIPAPEIEVVPPPPSAR